jgi:hypothetical protein
VPSLLLVAVHCPHPRGVPQLEFCLPRLARLAHVACEETQDRSSTEAGVTHPPLRGSRGRKRLRDCHGTGLATFGFPHPCGEDSNVLADGARLELEGSALDCRGDCCIWVWQLLYFGASQCFGALPAVGCRTTAACTWERGSLLTGWCHLTFATSNHQARPSRKIHLGLAVRRGVPMRWEIHLLSKAMTGKSMWVGAIVSAAACINRT